MSWLKSRREGDELILTITVGAQTETLKFHRSALRSEWIIPACNVWDRLKERQETLDAITKRLKR